MDIRVRRIADPLRNVIKRAVRHFSTIQGIAPSESRRLRVSVSFRDGHITSGDDTVSQGEGFIRQNSHASYSIVLTTNLGGHELLERLAHECTHLRQLVKGQLQFLPQGRAVYRSKQYNETDYPHELRPWEAEAHLNEGLMVKSYYRRHGRLVL